MKFKNLFYFLFVMMSVLLFLTSCTPSVPAQYLQKKEMEDIMFDYHIADAMYKESHASPAMMIAYKSAVLKKHGVNEADFDSSMVYYTRHTRLLQDIYESLEARLNKEAMAKGAAAREGFSVDLNTTNGDTVNIWTGDRSIVFSPYVPFNLESFTIPVDSAFHAGDMLLLDFDAQFIYQDGMRDAVAVMAVKFGNDSIASQNVRMSSPSHFSIRISDTNRFGIKDIKGYFLLNHAQYGADAYSTTFKLMILSNISLVRIHEKKFGGKSSPDSISSGHQGEGHALGDSSHLKVAPGPINRKPVDAKVPPVRKK